MSQYTTYSNPSWWTKDNDSSWDRVKAAFERDWDQTKHDMGGKQPNTNQQVKDTVKQASGKEAIPPRGTPVYEEVEPAYRFGYGARAHYGKKYSKWNSDLEKELKRDWSNTYKDRSWETDAEYIQSGWDYKE
ncbi:MAG TPA: hypothetical protein VH413_02695 [Verrucomicrobiae bacterium]|jgi:hypothetical protein|nr:hypothetical protein [Verrucomicrobiae bacterium]